MKTLLKLFAFWLFLLGIAHATRAQVETDLPQMHIYRDTVTNVCQARLYYRGRHFINVVGPNGKQWTYDIRIRFNEPITFKYTPGCYVRVSRKNYLFKVKVL